MTGLEKIIGQIEAEARQAADEALKAAKAQADELAQPGRLSAVVGGDEQACAHARKAEVAGLQGRPVLLGVDARNIVKRAPFSLN